MYWCGAADFFSRTHSFQDKAEAANDAVFFFRNGEVTKTKMKQ